VYAILAAGTAIFGFTYFSGHIAVRDEAAEIVELSDAGDAEFGSNKLSANSESNTASQELENLQVVREPDLIMVQDNQDNQDDQDDGLEDYYLHDGSLSSERIGELQIDQNFAELIAQLRVQTDPIAAEKRRSLELLFYSQDQTRDGSVSVDVFECGSRICAAELRASDQSAIEQFVSNVTNSSEFQGSAIVQLSGFRDDGKFQRLIFAHDSTIEGVTVPAELFGRQEN